MLDNLSITGTSTGYAGGGGGGGSDNPNVGGLGGGITGTHGGGGDGAADDTSTIGTDCYGTSGTDELWWRWRWWWHCRYTTGGSGGSGVVLIAYPT